MTNATYHSHYKSEKGSVFFYILLGVALFATLSFTVSRGMRGSQTNAMSDRKAGLVASDLLSYAQKMQRAVDKVRRNNCSESDISFHNSGWGHSNYEHIPNSSDSCKIFNPAGGNLSFNDVSSFHAKYLSGMNNYIFSGRSEVSGLGTTCASASCNELYIVIRMFHAANICQQINKRLAVSPDLPTSTGIYVDQLYDGSFSYGGTLATAAFNGHVGGCYQHTTATHTDSTPFFDFYYVLLER